MPPKRKSSAKVVAKVVAKRAKKGARRSPRSSRQELSSPPPVSPTPSAPFTRSRNNPSVPVSQAAQADGISLPLDAGISDNELDSITVLDEPLVQVLVSDDELPTFNNPRPTSGSASSHLEEHLKQKIIQGKFVAFSTLLPNSRTVEKLTFNSQSGLLQKTTSARKLYNFEEWLDAFTVFSSVRADAYPDEGSSLFVYLKTIKSINDRGGNFIRYDESFRCNNRGGASIDWGRVDPVELSWAMSDPNYTPYKQLTARKEGNIKRPVVNTQRANINSGHRTPSFKCYDFNNRSCTRFNCKYSHACMRCGGPHKLSVCPNKNSNNTTK